MEISVIKKMGVFVAIAFDDEGNEVDSVTALSKSNAKQLLEEKLGLKIKKPLKNQKKFNSKTNKANSGSIMTGLNGVTSARSWKKTK